MACQITFKKNGPNPAYFCLFSFFSHDKYSTNLAINEKSVDSVLGTQTQGGRMVCADESTELWWHPLLYIVSSTLILPVGSFRYSLSIEGMPTYCKINR